MLCLHAAGAHMYSLAKHTSASIHAEQDRHWLKFVTCIVLFADSPLLLQLLALLCNCRCWPCLRLTLRLTALLAAHIPEAHIE